MSADRLLDRPVDVYVGLGSNVGDRLAALRAAVAVLDGHAETAVEAASPVYETEAHVLPGAPPQRDHLNAAVRVRSRLRPEAFLREVAQAAERRAGRDPDAAPWSPRPLDVDVLLYGALVIPGGAGKGEAAAPLVVPHPRLAARRFVLRPLADLAPDLAVPGLGATVAELLAATPDRSRVDRTALVLG
ncbi:2-amino-4-hydroxy-6-hydroxymethyldihydropteridine diphosphokinase [Rubrivirga sp. S365]|uniref:2-amino-4-hydroxy-6-hydroxymethyldihydropteridine pyrophosphokinase n=1 Tax=Rubrivirga litoralis TaxID=3075598 RepID=A0ABU3BUE1_9BACT|nr:MULTISPECIES: 2-amino-4-hydroxy-6-hydroxymethyldihydropteridine diphosphokinase [unclassified Rubrivirga]MDT0632914.1 2-amino-4-hydroxy-6-hydroxymethyldihydropteridine diphosphokinase [Rubrivirga sp. F394]MDT7857462.1 2-amino-4-hydroxy-6-hydroxymethyldihydropteridine diphosphokinase [Rubrivirga sp. S365]